MTGTAVFSGDKFYRYFLTRIWNPERPSLTWVLCNPSTADESKDDPTMRRCIGFSMNAGYGGMGILNIFAYRSTEKAKLRKVEDPVGPHNDTWISLTARNSLLIVCAWGRPFPCHVWRHKQVLDLLGAAGRPMGFLRMTASGYPEHPLYLPSKLKFQTWGKP